MQSYEPWKIDDVIKRWEEPADATSPLEEAEGWRKRIGNESLHEPFNQLGAQNW